MFQHRQFLNNLADTVNLFIKRCLHRQSVLNTGTGLEKSSLALLKIGLNEKNKTSVVVTVVGNVTTTLVAATTLVDRDVRLPDGVVDGRCTKAAEADRTAAVTLVRSENMSSVEVS